MPSEALMLPMFGRPARMMVGAPEPTPIAAPAPNDGLRPYQVDAVEAIRRELQANRSTLLVMATGLGKTQTFGALAKHWPDRVLVLAHRDELIQQAQRRLEQMTGEMVDVEQADFRASGARLVVGSVQTLSRPARLERFREDTFGLVIVDEAHHAVAATYKRVLDWFGPAKVLGVTATPDRADEKAMGQVFDTVAYVREIEDGIRDGFLCPIRVRQVQVEAINLAAVRTTAGDLNAGDLDAVMAVEEAIHGVVKPTIEMAEDRRTIVFTTSVATAHRMAEVFGRYRDGCARAVDGETPFDERRAILAGHKRGEYQFLVNVGVLTEGYDDPAVACVAMARPTKSRALYAQCAGRGLRIFPGKSDCLLLDFVGNAGRHRLVSALDILAGKYTDDEVAKACKIVEDGEGVDAQKALEQAREQIEAAKREAEAAAARRAAVKAKKVQYSTRDLSPFDIFGVKDPAQDAWSAGFGAPATQEQIEQVKRFGIEPPKECTRAQAVKLVATAHARRRAGLCTFKQLRKLQQHGIDARKMYFEVASNLMTAIVNNGWRTPDPSVVQEIIARGRTVGAEG